jgi:site-specific DNA-methyltransferase (adenine-specific)
MSAPANEPPFICRPYYDEDGITIYHGDCRELDAWDIAGGVMVTDPPYGMAHRSGMAGKFGDCAIEGDADTATRNVILDRWAPRPALVFGRWSVPHPVETRMVLTWDKGDALGMGDLALPWKPSTEEIYVIGTGFTGRRNVGAVIRTQGIGPYQQARGERYHPTQKPVSLMLRLLDRCPPLATIVDPFMGSGSTLVAAAQMGRPAIGVELDERYCEIAVRRLAQRSLFAEMADG